MATLLARPAAAPPRAAAVDYDRLRLMAGVPFLIGIFLSFLGFAWDVQWHSDVGPDTFFTAPHLVLYSGVALSGLTALTVVLLTTFRYPGVREGTISVLRGMFRGPAGYVIGGIGAAMFLAYGALDEWWHSIYGFDVTLVSPPHVGLMLSIFISMIGCLAVFAAEVQRAAERGRAWFGPALGFAIAAALLIAFVTPSTVDVVADVAASLGLPVGPNGTITVLYSLALLMTAAVVRRPGAATLVAAVFTILRLGLWDLVPGITASYASSVGLFLRDNLIGFPVVPAMFPAYLLLAGIAVDLLVLAGRRFRWNVVLTVAVAGALVPVLLQLIEGAPAIYTRTLALFPVRPDLFSLDTLTSISLITIALGAISGSAGWFAGFVLRRHEQSHAVEPRPATASAPAALTTEAR